MALSNWDTFSVNEKGETGGSFISPLGVEVSIYKNWLYISDQKAWVDGCPYTKPIIMEVTKGKLTYKDVDIIAKRGPQSGIFCIISVPAYRNSEKKELAMVGAGVYGFDGEEWVGVTDVSIEFLENLLEEHLSIKVDLKKGMRFNQGDRYLSKKMGLDSEICTKVGESEEPIFMKMIKNDIL